MSRPSSFQIRKLERQIEAAGARELKRRLEVAQERVNRRIASMARDPKAATSKRFRDALEAEITRIYASLSLDFDKWLGDIVKTGGPAWAGETAGQIMQATGKKLPLMRFDRERVQRYQEMIAKENGEHLAAVFTRSMTDASIRQLRNATVDTFRQQVIEGWTANETHKRLQQAWDRLAGNESGRRFVDRGGKEWTNSRYLQMLTRTTMQRVSREIEIDTLADNGFSLARISADAGDPCPICEAWQGVVIRVAGSGEGGGRFPTYQQSLDAGMWHPNCTHRPEYIDEDLEADEIKRQAEQPSPGAWEDPDAVRAYSDGINQKRYRDEGLSAAEARRAVMRDRLKDRARSGMVSERFDDAIDAIPDKVLDQMQLNQLPHFRLSKKEEEPVFSRNSPKGGWVVLDRTAAGKAEFDKAFYSLQTKRGVDTTAKAVAEKPKANPKEFGSVKEAGLYMRGVMSTDMDKYIMRDGKPVTRFSHGRKKPIDRIGVVDLGTSSTELASVIANEMEAIGEECKRLGIPMLRGIYTSKRGAASMGDGVLSINPECLANRLKSQSVISKATASGMVTGPASVKTTLWHETAHHIHQQYGVIDGVTYKNPPMESQIKQAYMQSGKGKNSVSDYARTGGHKEWFAENYALAKTGRQSEVDNSPALMALFKQIGVM